MSANAVPSNAELLDLIDAELIGLLAVAYFGPAEKGTARSVDQACAAEVLLFRLRLARRAVRELAVAYGIKSPVRRDPEAARRASAIATTGGPVNVPGESLSPGCGNGRVGGAPGAATFSLPERLGLPRFGEGEDRLVGSVEFTAGSATYRGVR